MPSSATSLLLVGLNDSTGVCGWVAGSGNKANLSPTGAEVGLILAVISKSDCVFLEFYSDVGP